ncbi:MAG: amidohydrolase family protein [Candidatus Solibacter usitatus]|nr:amidohydrolase family protein [Candidatus Solibacter usitatus]
MRFAFALLAASCVYAQQYDIVIRNGRVLDPESRLDAVRNVGIRNGKIAAISATPLNGRRVIDATGLVVAPGFIDLHSHGQDAENYRVKALDGVTSALECEIGVADPESWYREREGKALVNFGATVGHVPVRMARFRDSGAFLPADRGAHTKPAGEDITEMARTIERGLQQGAVGVGMGVMYTPGASAMELLSMFKVAARFKAPVYVHVRSGVEGLNEVIGYAAVSGAPLHVVHLNSSGARRNTVNFLDIIAASKQRGMDVTTECYPYTAGQTNIQSTVYDDGWQQRMGVTYSDLLWVATGERLTAESFARYRKTGGSVISFTNSEEMVRTAALSPLTMIASDGILRNGLGHPRSTGTYSRILSAYVREEKALPLMEAIRKMALMPAQRLEARVPAMRNKGRIKMGADADLVVFDAQTVADRSTYEKPAVPSEGFRFVLVGGVPVVEGGRLNEKEYPGRGVRAGTQADPLRGDLLYKDVRAYAEIGVHRTGTTGDHRTNDWLAARLREMGYAVKKQEWTTPQFHFDSASVVVEGKTIRAFPLWLPKAGVVSGTLAIEPEKGKLAVGSVATIQATTGESGEIAAINAAPITQDRSKVLVGPADMKWLEQAAARDAKATVSIQGRFDANTKSHNVIATAGSSGKWIIVSTPSSGWFQCAGERGTGIAIWLALAQRAVSRNSGFRYMFVANSGHELDFLGARKLLESGIVPQPQEVAAWFHFGANAAMRSFRNENGRWVPVPEREPGRITADEQFHGMLRSAFPESGGYQVVKAVGPGELGLWQKAGYPSYGIVSRNLWFHTARDGMESTTPEFLETVARASARSLDLLEQK